MACIVGIRHVMFTGHLLAHGAALCAFALKADILNTNAEHFAIPPVQLTFCYEDKQLLPYYAGNSRDIPGRPGATIEHLRLASQVAGVQLNLVRLPWLRCLQQLEDNNVDAIVAAVEPDRLHYTHYPKTADGKPDQQRAINQLGLCLAHRFDNPISAKINSDSQPLTISRPLGYRPSPFPHNAVLVGVQSPQNALDLVVNHRVDATTVLCQLNGVNAKEQHLNMLPIQLMYPPLHQSDGYLMLSNEFVRKHPKLSEQLWNALPATLNRQSYLDYLQYSE